MKGQLTVEYYISLIIFAIFIAYLAFQLIGITPNFMSALRDENLRIEAYKLSELLVNDPGEPIDWEITNVKRIGLSSNENKTNLLSQEKINALQNKCSANYEETRRLLGTEYNFSLVLINKTSNEVLIDCKPTITPTRGTNVTISRIIALDDNSFGELILHVW